ncbi:TolC family protein [Mariniflexile sp. AS56]|uniref:TolC family protein n=1 Tax=Mariniflexile sp. AS56 TaxID=3063957 RepID=UPI0026F2ED4C|nr:TolC family protein [Mariniflexile sp. AS56]MDO7173371.1 TolC family protein [Mariniflexile sp. AS56]
MKYQLILIFSLLLSISGFGQETKQRFSLQEAIDHALEHNRTIKNAYSNIQIAKQTVRETTAQGLPQVNGAIDYTTNIKTPFDTANLDPDSPFLFLYPKHNMSPSVSLSQLIFDGGYIVGLQANKVFLSISQLAKDQTLNNVETMVVSAYNNALFTQESVIIMKNNIFVLTNNLNETAEIYKNGLVEEEDVEQLQLTLSNLELNLKNMETLHTISMGYLKFLLGIDSDGTIKLTDSLDSLIMENISLELINTTHSVSNNLNYKMADNDVLSKKLEYKLERSKQLPTLTGFINSSYLGYSDHFSNYFKKEQEWLFTTTGGVSLKVPIFSSFQGRARRQKSKIEWDIANTNLKETEEKLKLDFKTAKNEYVLAIDTYGNKQKNLKLAEKIENKNTIKYKEGLVSSFDLRQAQMQLYTSQQEYLQAIIDVINKKSELKNLLNIKK